MWKVVRIRKTGPRNLWPLLAHGIVSGVVLMSFVSVAALAAVSIPPSNDEAEQTAIDYLRTSCAALGLTDSDVADVVVKYVYPSKHNGVTHVYLRQRYQGIEVAGADMTLNVLASGRVGHVGHRFVSLLASRVEPAPPSLSAADAQMRMAADLGASASATRGDVPARLVYSRLADGSLRLAWELEVSDEEEYGFCGNILVDSTNGEILERWSWTADFTVQSAAPSRSTYP